VAWVVFRAPSLADAGAILGSIAGLNGIDLRLTVHEWSGLARRGVPPAELYGGLAVLATFAVAMVLAFTPRNSNQVAESLDLRLPRIRYAFGLLLAASLVYVQDASEFIYFIF
jgi:hypothetical protein